jgi:hypothetical protein
MSLHPMEQFRKGQSLSVKAVYLLLIQYDKYSFLPELYDIIGEAAMTKLLERFAGQSIKFPSEAELLDIVRKLKIYSRLYKVQPGRRRPVIEELASDLDMTPESVQVSFTKTKKELEDRLNSVVL